MPPGYVLVVDDDQALRESVCELLEEEGFVAAAADSGSSALKRLREEAEKPSVILLDLMMPVMNGWQFREQQLQDAAIAEIPVVLMTANRELQGIVTDEILYKPVKLQTLLETVKRHVERRALSDNPSPPSADEVARPAARESRTPAEPESSASRDSGELFVGTQGERMRGFDWSHTPLGPVDAWSASLRSALSICLGSRFPIALYWGAELTLLYNDAWSAILGQKHPWALGRPGKDVWPELWDTIGPMFAHVMNTGESTYSEDSLLLMNRHGYTEECYFNYTFTPVRGGGRVEGIFNAVIETTFRVIAERRTRVLRELAEETPGARSLEDACERAVRVLARDAHDVPFCGIYLVDEVGTTARRVAVAGLEPENPSMPASVSRGDEAGTRSLLGLASWSAHIETIDQLDQRVGPLPGGPWPVPTTTALVAPILAGATSGPSGFLIVGASARRAVDDEYCQFAERAAALIATVITSVNAYAAERARAESLAEIDRAKTNFFSNVSHEFRTPLTLMLGPIEDLLRGVHGELGAAQRRQLELMQRNSVRLQKLVNALLDFSRLEAGRLRATYAAVDLAALTRQLASAFDSAIERAGLELVLDCPPTLEPAYVDRDMWEKIVLNLVSNALKFTFEGRIGVALHAREEHWVLRVSDTGVGIPEGELPRLFERFHRIEGVRARTHEGSGIGLAFVQELVKLHGGTVHVESQEGVGTSLSVAIPKGSAHLPKERVVHGSTRLAEPGTGAAPFVEEALRWLPAEPRPADEAWSSEEESHVVALGIAALPARILLADDNADMRDYVREHLERHWVVETAATGEQALAAARANPPDLMLTDVMMPDMDGFALLRSLRADQRTSGVPVVMLSARSGEEAKLEGLRAGAEDYLTKPFSPRELLARVRTHLELARVRRAVEAERDQLQSLLGQIPAVVNFLRGPELVFEYAHPLAMAAVGDRPLLGRPLLEAIPELRDQELPILLRRVLESGERVEGREQLRRHALGTGEVRESYWNFAYLPVRDTRGRIDGVMTFEADVTDQVLARARVEHGERRFRKLVEQVQAGIAQTDLSGRFTFANERYREIVGRSGQELQQQRMQELTHPMDLPATNERFERLVTRGTPFVLEKRCVKPDGSVVWVQESVSGLDDRDGLIIVAIDITQRKYAEAALQQSEERVRELYQKEEQARKEAESLYRVAEGLAEAKLDLEALVQRLTDHAAALVGAAFGAFFYNAVDESGKTYLLYTLSGADRAAFTELGLPRNTPLFEETFSGTAIVRLHDVLADPRYGQLAPHYGMPRGHLPVRSYLAVPVVLRSGETIGGLFFGHPEPGRFTEQHERMVAAIAANAAVALDNARLYQTARTSETRFRAIFELAEVAILEQDFSTLKEPLERLRDEHGSALRSFLEADSAAVQGLIDRVRIRDLNPATLRMFEAPDKETFVGALATVFVDARSAFVEQMMALAEGRNRSSGEWALRTLRGRRLDVLLTMSSANAERALLTLVDISARKASERERETRVTEMERAVRFSETFVGIVGHDLRNPLGAITTAANLLQLRGDSDKVLKPASRILSSAERMERMISQLLDFTRIRLGGGIPLHRGPVDLAETARQIMEELEGAPGVERRLSLETAGDVAGSWDRDRLSQLLSNLAANARQHGEPGTPVTVRIDGSQAGSVRIEVHNHGVIPPQMLPVVFEPLRSGERHANRAGASGLGLGLYITQQIVAAHGGTIHVESNEVEGTRFVVSLPRASEGSASRVFSG